MLFLFQHALKGHYMPAQGNALGINHPPYQKRPERAKEFTLLPLQGDVCTSTLSQGAALG